MSYEQEVYKLLPLGQRAIYRDGRIVVEEDSVGAFIDKIAAAWRKARSRPYDPAKGASDGGFWVIFALFGLSILYAVIKYYNTTQ